MLLAPGHQLNLGVSISYQKPMMLFFSHYFRQCKPVFQLHNSIDTVTAGFLKCLVYVSKLWERRSKDIIRAKPPVTPILLAAILWQTRVITERVCKSRCDWLELCYFPHDFYSHLVRRIEHVLLKSEVTSQKATSNGSWCMGIKGEMSGTVCVTFTWYMYLYELFIAYVCFVVCSLL